MRELKGALLEMIDQVHAPEEFPSLLLTLAGVFVDSIDEEKKEKVFTRFCLSQRDFDAKVTDIELRANLLAVLKRTLSPAVPISISQKVSRKRDKTQAEKTRWSSEEDERLREGCRLYGIDWRKIVEHVGGRTRYQVYQRAFYLKLTKPTLLPELSKTIQASPKIDPNPSLT